MPVVGLMPVVRSKASDLCGWIWGCLEFVLVALVLQRLELGSMGRTDVSFNKAVVFGLLLLWSRGAGDLLLAGRGGGGKKQTGSSICASGGWRGRSLLQIGENHTVARLATVICDRRDGLSKRRSGVSSTSSAEALTEASRRNPAASRRQVVCPRRCQDGRRWRLPSGGEEPGLDCVFYLCCRVLSANVSGLCVTLLFFRGPGCNLFPPLF